MSTVTLEADVDLTRNQSMLKEYETQYASVGFEWDLLHTLAIRLGQYRDLTSDDIGPVMTAGLGFNLFALRVDMGAAVSSKATEVGGTKLPSEARFNMELTADW
jgi:hypothetical protein